MVKNYQQLMLSKCLYCDRSLEAFIFHMMRLENDGLEAQRFEQLDISAMQWIFIRVSDIKTCFGKVEHLAQDHAS